MGQLDSHKRKKPKKIKRTSTKFSMAVGTTLVFAGLVISLISIKVGAITGSEIVNLVWAHYITAAGFFSINLGRVTAESWVNKRNFDEEEDNPHDYYSSPSPMAPPVAEEPEK